MVPEPDSATATTATGAKDSQSVAQEAFERIARRNGRKKKEKQWGDEFIEELTLSLTRIRTRVPLKVMVFFTRQLATMFAAGLTLEKALSNLAAEEKHPRFKKVLTKVAEDIRKGYSLSEAMERHPGVFSPLYVALVKAGEVSGSLQGILDDLAGYLENVHDTNQKVKSALYYPILVFIFLGVILTVLLIFIVPRFSAVYAQLNTKLPAATQLLIKISGLLKDNILAAIGIAVMIWVGFWMISLTRRGGYLIDSLKIRMPVFGPLINYNIFNKLSKTLGILLGAGVPVLPSLQLVKRIVSNRVYANALEMTSEYVRDGYTISSAMKITERFPPILLQLIATGEETGEIDTLLQKAADFYSKQVNAIVSRMTSIIEPLMIIFVGGLILMILMATYLPVFYIGQAMRHGL